MNLRKISLYGSVKERFIQQIYRQSPLVHFLEIILLLAHADCSYFYNPGKNTDGDYLLIKLVSAVLTAISIPLMALVDWSKTTLNNV
jgi:hypothetical protein